MSTQPHHDRVQEPFDLVVTVCNNVKESCPVFPGATKLLYWPFRDPARATGSDEARRAFVCEVRNEIRDAP